MTDPLDTDVGWSYTFLMSIIQHVSEAYSNGTLAIILGALFAISEALALIPSVEANSIFQALQNGIKSILSKLPKKPE